MGKDARWLKSILSKRYERKTQVEMKPRAPYHWKACTPCEQNPSDTAVPRSADDAIQRVGVPTVSYQSVHEESLTEWR